MRKTKIGVMDFHGSVDITDPCYNKDVWCRMNNVKISEGESMRLTPCEFLSRCLHPSWT